MKKHSIRSAAKDAPQSIFVGAIFPKHDEDMTPTPMIVKIREQKVSGSCWLWW